jgi:hypothetical protein
LSAGNGTSAIKMRFLAHIMASRIRSICSIRQASSQRRREEQPAAHTYADCGSAGLLDRSCHQRKFTRPAPRRWNWNGARSALHKKHIAAFRAHDRSINMSVYPTNAFFCTIVRVLEIPLTLQHVNSIPLLFKHSTVT